MKVSLGIDTGGTYTDAVVFDEQRGVLAKAKSLTTRHDLAIGIAGAVDRVMLGAQVAAAEIGLVALSTTLATNALVEGRGGRVALVFIGFGENDVRRAGLVEAMRGEPIIRVAGGHDPQGDPIATLDLDALQREAVSVAPFISGFAVTGQFSTRNSDHEIAARDLLVGLTGLPVTCGHELSAKLNGPKRALTSVLNARLIGLITDLIVAAEQIIGDHGIDAPLMVVRGDGSLMSAAMAKARPIETILSGPAASLVGAAYLTGAVDALVADIGGTTTDVAVVERGVPHLDPSGAVVGGHHTMVEAVAMTTVALGGDSEVTAQVETSRPGLRLGPRRVVPISMIAVDHPELVHRILDRQLLQEVAGDHDARFVVPVGDSGASSAGLDPGELALLRRAHAGLVGVAELVKGNADLRRLDRLVSRGLLMLAAFTPTDASHVLGDFVKFDRDAAEKAAVLMARKRTMLGKPVVEGARAWAEWVVSTLQRRSAETILDVALGIDGFEGNELSRHPLVASSLDRRVGVADVSIRLSMPLIGLGASAGLYYPQVAAMLRADGIVPPDADVANAIGAVVGRVRVHVDVYVSSPERGRFRVHHPSATNDLDELDQALALADQLAADDAGRAAVQAGAGTADVIVDRLVNTATVEGDDFFVDATVTATASGRPRPAATSNPPRP